MKRRTFSLISVLLTAAVFGAIVLLNPAGASTESQLAAGRGEAEVDPAALELGNSNAGAMMAMINRAISLHD